MNPKQAYEYCEKHGRNTKLEKIILRSATYAYFYAKKVIKGRWEEAENIIIENSFIAYAYATNIIKDKLPENMHNVMIAHGLDPDDPNYHYAKLYARFINNLTPSV